MRSKRGNVNGGVQSRSRVFYVGMITPDSYGAAIGEETYASAAERKMMLVTRALRSVGQRALIVSLPFVGDRGRRVAYNSVITFEYGVLLLFTPTFRSRYIRKILGPFFLAGLLQCHVRPGDTVILYNHSVEYMVALTLLRLRGIRVVHDIEDVPILGERGVRSSLNRLGFAMTSRMTSRRKMVVAEHVARSLNLEDYVVIRGVAAGAGDVPHATHRKWAALRAGGALILHFGGTLLPDTGVDLFCAAVEALSQLGEALPRPIVFKVTGTGAFDRVRALQSSIGAHGRVRLEISEQVGKRDYDALIQSCHAGLSLRRPGADYSNTTFPSKVIEITSRGIALISSDQGDVSTLFDARTAFLLNSYTETALVETIICMAVDAERVQRVASAGKLLCEKIFAQGVVAGELTKLMLD